MIPPRIVSLVDFPVGRLRFSKKNGLLRTGEQSSGPDILSGKAKDIDVTLRIDPSTGISFEGGKARVTQTETFLKNEQRVVRLSWTLETTPQNPQKDDVMVHVEARYAGETDVRDTPALVKLTYLTQGT